MPTSNQSDDGTIEECVDELGDFLTSLDRYHGTVLAFALRVHLEELLRVLLESKVNTREQMQEFLHDLEREVLQPRWG